MDELDPPTMQLLTKMSQKFPEIPRDTILFYVKQHSQETCEQLLALRREHYGLPSHPTMGDSSIVNKLDDFILNNNSPDKHMENIQRKSVSYQSINEPDKNYGPLNAHNFGNMDSYNFNYKPRNTENRSLSYAGITVPPPESFVPRMEIQSAPTGSENFYGFESAFRYPQASYGYQFQPMPINSSGYPVSQASTMTIPHVPGNNLNYRLSFPSARPITPFGCEFRTQLTDKSQHMAVPSLHSNIPIRTPYDAQLRINIDPPESFAQGLGTALHSPHRNYPFHAQTSLMLSPGFAHPAQNPSNEPIHTQGNIFSLGNYMPPPQLVVSPTYWNYAYDTSPKSVSPGEQRIRPSTLPVPPSNNQQPHSQTYTEALINHQTSRLDTLKLELQKRKQELAQAKEAVQKLEQQVQDKKLLPNMGRIKQLREENTKLQVECRCLIMEIDTYVEEKAPLGMLDVDFYKNIFTGQQGPIPPVTVKAPRKSPELGAEGGQKLLPSVEDEENKEINKWQCSQCTFGNHPAITVCEQCNMPRAVPALRNDD